MRPFVFITDVWQKGFFHLLTSNALIQLVGFASQLLVAWILPPEDIGRIRLIQTYVGLGTILAGLGFNTSVLKLCSENRPVGEKKFLYLQALKYTWIGIVLILSVITAISYAGFLSTDALINSLLPVFAWTIVPNVIGQLIITYFQARKRIIEFAFLQVLTRVFAIAMIVGFTWIWLLEGFVAASIMGLSLTTIVLFLKARRLDAQIIPVEVPAPLHVHWNFAKYSFMANAVGQIGLYTDIYLINYLIADKILIGYYSFAVTLMIALQMVTTTIQQIATPYFSERQDNPVEFLRVFSKYNTLFLGLSICVGLASLFVVPWASHLVFGGKYDDSSTYFQLLTLGWIIRNMYSLKGVAILGLGKIHLNFYSTVMVLPVSILGTFLLIRRFGAVGASYGSIFGALMTWGIESVQFRRATRGFKA